MSIQAVLCTLLRLLVAPSAASAAAAAAAAASTKKETLQRGADKAVQGHSRGGDELSC